MQLPFAFRRSIATDGRCVVSCLSLVNDAITVSCNDQTLTIAASGGDAAWVAVGTDAPVGHPFNGLQLGYVGSVILTDITGGADQTLSVTQNGVTQTANIYAVADGSLTDFALFFNTCDNSSLGGSAPGYYQYMRTYANTAGNLPVAGILHPDDHYGYPDYGLVDDEAYTGHYYIAKKAGGTAADGLTAFAQGAYPSQTMFQYDYALGVFAAFGLFGNSSDAYVAYGHNTDLQWGYQNLGVAAQFGDHDCGVNEMGWDKATAGDKRFINARAVWDAIMKPLIAAEITATQNLDTTAQHWAETLGPLRIVAPDSITNGSGNATLPLDAGNGPTTLFGANQIADLKAACNTRDEFKLLLMANGIRYMATSGDGGVTLEKNNALAQNPLADECPVEYASLFTADDGVSIMGNPKTNGVLGTTVCLHGDVHVMSAVKHENTAGVKDEWFYSIHVGTGTGSPNFKNEFGLVAGDTHGGSTLEAVDTGQMYGRFNDYYGCRIDVYASEFPKRLEIGLYDKGNAVKWNKQFVAGRGGNGAYALDKDLSLKAGAIEVGFDD